MKKSKTINWIFTILADSLSFWSVFLFCIMLYNTGVFGYARTIFDVSLIEVFLAYLLFIYVLYNNGAYRKKRDFAGIQRLKSVIKGVLQAVVIYIVLAYTIKYQIPRIISVTFIITIPVIVILLRILVQLIESKLFHHLNQENVLVYGAGTVGTAFVSAVEKLTTAPLNIVGFVDDRVPIGEFSENKIPILGGLKDVETIIQNYKIDHIIVAIKEPKLEINLSLEDISNRHHIAMSFHPTQKLFESNPYRLKDIAGLPLLSTTQQQIDSRPFYDLFKRMIDFSIAFIGISITLPLWLIIGLVIKINYNDNYRYRTILLNRYKEIDYNFEKIVGPMEYILENSSFKDYREYTKLNDDDKIDYIIKYWDLEDADKEYSSQLFKEFYKRVEYADRNFTYLTSDGWYSDRGRIYIIYGKPLEIKEEFTTDGEYQIWIYKNNKQFVFNNRFGPYKLIETNR